MVRAGVQGGDRVRRDKSGVWSRGGEAAGPSHALRVAPGCSAHRTSHEGRAEIRSVSSADAFTPNTLIRSRQPVQLSCLSFLCSFISFIPRLLIFQRRRCRNVTGTGLIHSGNVRHNTGSVRYEHRKWGRISAVSAPCVFIHWSARPQSLRHVFMLSRTFIVQVITCPIVSSGGNRVIPTQSLLSLRRTSPGKARTSH